MRLSIILATSLAAAACGESPRAAADSSADTAPAPPAGPIEATVVQCTYTDSASIQNVRAAQWRAEYYGSGDVRSLNLTVWRPIVGGPDRVSLAASKDGRKYLLADGGQVNIEEDDEGGARFIVDGLDQHGNPLHATVSCGEFLEAVVAGG
jgi:hypothetical protein